MSTKENNSVVLKSKKKAKDVAATTTTTALDESSSIPKDTEDTTSTSTSTSTTNTTNNGDNSGDVPMVESIDETNDNNNNKNGNNDDQTSTTTTTTTTSSGTKDSIIENANRMDIDDEEDYVVQEIPVYLSQQLSDNLFLFQYPLRQPWRAYDMNQLDSLRIKPRQQRVEMDFNMDLGPENYNENADIKTEKYTLGSTTVSHRANYAIGLLRNDEFHITPLQSIIQLRPSFGTVDNMWEAEKEQKKKEKQEEGIDDEEGEDGDQQPASYRKPSAAKQAATQPANQLKKMEDEEQWIKLELIPDKLDDNNIAQKDKLVCDKREAIKLDLNEYQYVDLLCPRTIEEWVPKASHLQETVALEAVHQMDWKAQVKQILLNGHVITFTKLFQLLKLPLDGKVLEYDVVEEVQNLAHLIRGRWVVKSEVEYKEKQMQVARDYLLLQFFEEDSVNRQVFGEKVFLTNEQARDMVSRVATLNVVTRTWHLKSQEDEEFIFKYHGIVDSNRKYFIDSKNEILKKVKDLSDPTKNSFLGSLVPLEFMQKAVGTTTKPNQIQNIIPEDYKEGKTAEQQLLFFLYHLFKTHGVITNQFIKQHIIKQVEEEQEGCKLNQVEDEMVKTTLPKIANTMHQTWYLKQLGQPNIDRFRNCVLEAFQKKMVLKKSDVTAICMQQLNEDCPGSTLSVIMSELAISKGASSSTWIYKRPN